MTNKPALLTGRPFRPMARTAFLSALLALSLALSSGCSCDPEVGGTNPLEITFKTPQNMELILEGKVTVQVKDLDGVKSVQIFVKEDKIATLKGKGTSDDYTASFNLDKYPDVLFEISVTAEDNTGETKTEKIRVRRDTSGPNVTFVKPAKVDSAHKVVFVGKKFDMAVKVMDPDGVLQAVLSVRSQDGKGKAEVGKFSGKEPGGKDEHFETKVDVSAPQFPDGWLWLTAVASDKEKHSTTQEKKIYLDKTGPAINIVRPAQGQQISGQQEFRAEVTDQVGVKTVKFYVGTAELPGVKPDPADPKSFFTVADASKVAAGAGAFKVVATDLLGNTSEKSVSFQAGCQSDSDCKTGTRCCLVPGHQNKGGCFPIVTAEGALCRPCTNPCGKGKDGKTMGCVPGVCERPPYVCRSACDRGNVNKRPDACGSGEYCAQSDISLTNPRLGACAKGDNCDPFTQRECAKGAIPPYKSCCPKGFGCFPADDDANVCMPEGSKGPAQENCSNADCKGGVNCKKGYLCTTPTDQTGKPTGASRCTKMCHARYNSMTKKWEAVMSSADCGGKPCVPVVLMNGNVPLPVGSCLTCSPSFGACSTNSDCCSGRCMGGMCM